MSEVVPRRSLVLGDWFLLASSTKPTMWLMDDVACNERFRDAVVRWAPPNHVLRELGQS